MDSIKWDISEKERNVRLYGDFNHNTRIEWTHHSGYKGETWNPIIGCWPISPGCANCYAARVGTNLAKNPKAATAATDYGKVTDSGKWNGRVVFRGVNTLEQPYRWRSPRCVFVGSMTDIFYPLSIDYPFVRELEMSRIYIQKTVKDIFEVMTDFNNSHHRFIILTKRISMADKFFARYYPDGLPNNVWVGTSIEDAVWANRRIPNLANIKCSVKFLSVEPLLGPISFSNNILDNEHTIDWVIVGGESGPNARPMHIEWVRNIRDWCDKSNIPFFFKQWGEWIHGDEIERDNRPIPFPDLSLHTWSDGSRSYRFGKRFTAQHNTIDGVYHLQIPEVN